MKTNASGLSALICLTSTLAFSQGSLVFDQQSATGGLATGGASIVGLQPLGQSFTPSLSGVGFVQFQFADLVGGLGATVYVNLREQSITGNILATTSPVLLSNGFRGTAVFYFATNVSVIPGTVYYFQPTLQSGGDVGVLGAVYDYRGGTLYTEGLATTTPGLDFWFREGIVAPESSTLCLGFLGMGLLFLGRHFRRR